MTEGNGECNSPKRNEAIKEKESDKPDESHEEAEIIQVLKLTKGKINGPEGAASILNMRASKIEEAERKWILNALKEAAGRIRGENGAAEKIGVKATTLEARMKKLHITKAEIFS